MNEQDRQAEQPKPPYEHLRRPEPKRRPQRFVAPLVLSLVVALVLYDQVPWVRTTIDRALWPAEHQAREVCARSALAAANEPRYARVVADGKVHRTSDAYYVEHVVVGEMGADGNETRFTYNCYVAPSGTLIRGTRGAPPEPPRSAGGESR